MEFEGTLVIHDYAQVLHTGCRDQGRVLRAGVETRALLEFHVTSNSEELEFSHVIAHVVELLPLCEVIDGYLESGNILVVVDRMHSFCIINEFQDFGALGLKTLPQV